MPIITLTTDYGWHDYYVGAIKGAILSISPQCTIVDISHDIEPHNVAHAAFVLRHAFAFYPVGTIHLVVVDPGVGTPRRILLAGCAGQFVIAPDNGILTWLHGDFGCESLHMVEDRRYFLPTASATFHGRDIMAPVAAHLATGTAPGLFGRTTDRIETLPLPGRAAWRSGVLCGIVVYVDRFGNLVTNLRAEQLAGETTAREVFVDGTAIGPVRSTFADVAAGEPVAYLGSAGFMEIGVNRGRAADRFGPASAIRIEVRSG